MSAERYNCNLTNTKGNLLLNTNITAGNVNAAAITCGNLTVTGTTTSVNVTQTNVVDTSITTGTLVVTGNSSLNGITAGNINFTGNLYQNGSLYSPSSSPVYGIYYNTSSYSLAQGASSSNVASSFTPYVSMSGLSFSSGTWTNTSGSTLTLRIEGMMNISGPSNCGIRILMAGGKIYNMVYGNNIGSITMSLVGIITLTNGGTFTMSADNLWYGTVSINGGSYPDNSGYTSVLYISVLH